MRYSLFAAALLLGLASSARGQHIALSTVPGAEEQVVGPPSSPAPPAAPAVYLTAEQMPAFPGGDAAMLKFLSRQLQYPAAALERRLSGKVHVRFTVDSEGRLRDPQVVKGLGSGLDEEALRLLRLMPWWTPGRVQGQPVWVTMTMPIIFRAL